MNYCTQGPEPSSGPTAGIVDLIWNTGEDNFLALFSDSSLKLYAQEEKSNKTEFDKQQSGISKVCWLDNVSGDFLTTSARVGVLRVWNAA
jgi:WD40 repeat protein